MSNSITDLARYLISNDRQLRFEAEAKSERLDIFFTQYQDITNEQLTYDTDGIVRLQDDADKWGLELRIYISDDEDFPHEYSNYLTSNTRFEHQYQAYAARLNSNDIILELFRIGFRIGESQDRQLILNNIR